MQTCAWENTSPDCDDGNVLNGYWWRQKAWIPVYPSTQSWFTPLPLYSYGDAVFYEQGVMEANAEVRDLSLSNFVDGVALMSPANIGLPVWLKRPNHDWEGPFLVVDTVMRGDAYPLIVYINEIVEVGFKTAKNWGMVNEKGQVEIWKMKGVEVSKITPSLLDQPVVNYQQWWLDNLQPATVKDLFSPIYISPTRWRINGVWIIFKSPDPFFCCKIFIYHR